MNLQISPKIPDNLYCDKCKYTAKRISDFKKHLVTKKHNNWNTPTDIKIYTCECGNTYKHRQSLHNHKNTCTFNEHNTHQIDIIDTPQNTIVINEPCITENSIEILLKQLIEQNKQSNTQNKILIEQSNTQNKILIEQSNTQNKILIEQSNKQNQILIKQLIEQLVEQNKQSNTQNQILIKQLIEQLVEQLIELNRRSTETKQPLLQPLLQCEQPPHTKALSMSSFLYLSDPGLHSTRNSISTCNINTQPITYKQVNVNRNRYSKSKRMRALTYGKRVFGTNVWK